MVVVEVVALMMVVVIVGGQAAVVVLGGGYSSYGDVGGGAGVAAVAAGTLKGPPVLGVCTNPILIFPKQFSLVLCIPAHMYPHAFVVFGRQ